MELNEKIDYLSALLNEGEDVIKELESAINKFKKFKNKYEKIDSYYRSDELKDDLASEKAGLINESINKGILGQDYAYNFLENYEFYEKIIKKL